MKNCPKCKTPNRNEDRYCGLCRHDFDSIKNPQPPALTKQLQLRKSGHPYFAYPSGHSNGVIPAVSLVGRTVKVITDRGHQQVDMFKGTITEETSTHFRVFRKGENGTTTVNELVAKSAPPTVSTIVL